MKKTEFRGKKHHFLRGFYITDAQLNFSRLSSNKAMSQRSAPDYKNRGVKGRYKFYMEWFKLYNLVYDLNDLDPKAAYVFWDDKKEILSYCIDTEYIQKRKAEDNVDLFDDVGVTFEEENGD